jgi:hypothetical protein
MPGLFQRRHFSGRITLMGNDLSGVSKAVDAGSEVAPGAVSEHA